jgi:hypothetical protein
MFSRSAAAPINVVILDSPPSNSARSEREGGGKGGREGERE